MACFWLFWKIYIKPFGWSCLIHTLFFSLIIPSFINLQILICFDSRMTRYKSQIPAIYNGNCQLYLVIKFDASFLDDKFLVTIHCMLRNHYLFYSYCLIYRKYPAKNILQQLVFYSTASWVEIIITYANLTRRNTSIYPIIFEKCLLKPFFLLSMSYSYTSF